MEPHIGVVIATHNRATMLPDLVAGLAAQRGVDAFEVVIVDDGSTDETWQVLQQLATSATFPIRVERLARNAGPATARNLGWRATTAPLVAFTDDDCIPTPNWLHELSAAAVGVDVVQGRTLPKPEQYHLLGPFSRTLDISFEQGFYQTCNIAYRREFLERLGGFHEQFRYPAGEDTDLAWRAKESGARTRFVEAAVVHHDVRRSNVRVAVGDSWRWQSVALLVHRHPQLRETFASTYVWRKSHPLAIGVAAGAAMIARQPRSPRAWFAGVALVAPYVHYRIVTAPLPTAGPRRRWLLLPGAWAVDAAEVVSCLTGSLRHRSVVI